MKHRGRRRHRRADLRRPLARSRRACGASPPAPACTWSWAAATTSTTTRIRRTTAAASTSFAQRDDRPGAARRLGHRRARRHDRRDRLPGAVDRRPRSSVMQAALIAASGDGRRDQRPSRPPSRPAAGGRRLHQGGGPADRARGDQPHRPHHLRRGAAAAARRTRASPSSSTCSARRRATTGCRDIDMPNDATRLGLIRALIDHGHLDRVVISHDICYRTRLATLRRPRLRPHLPQRRADDEGARLQRGRDRRHPGAQSAAAADVRLVA